MNQEYRFRCIDEFHLDLARSLLFHWRCGLVGRVFELGKILLNRMSSMQSIRHPPMTPAMQMAVVNKVSSNCSGIHTPAMASMSSLAAKISNSSLSSTRTLTRMSRILHSVLDCMQIDRHVPVAGVEFVTVSNQFRFVGVAHLVTALSIHARIEIAHVGDAEVVAIGIGEVVAARAGVPGGGDRRPFTTLGSIP